MRSSPSRWRRPCNELHCESDAVTVIQHARLQLWWFIPTLWHFAGQEGGCGKTLSWCRPSELPRVRGSCCWLRRRLKVSDNRFSDAFFRFWLALSFRNTEVTIFSDIDGRIAIVFLNIKQQFTEASRVYEQPR